MIDFEKIGKRIQEERKYIRGISQERMAVDLNMYQADISNLEKAKNGSGITDLNKLDMIAEYFDMPLETLLFGRRQDQMEKYYGSKMQLKEYTKKRTQRHETILRKLLGLSNDEQSDAVLERIKSYECGPYMIYVAFEFQNQLMEEAGGSTVSLIKAHIFVIYQDAVIGSTIAGITTMMQHVYQPAFEQLKTFLEPDVFNLDETMTVLNPFWLLARYATTEVEAEDFRQMMFERMDQLRAAGEDRVIFYVESAYVREDCRRNGIFKMMIDVLKNTNGNALIWLNLEPTSGTELTGEYGFHPVYEASELGQINLNASIAEHLGFTIDTKTVDRQAMRIEEDGALAVDTVPVRRIAYYLPKKIRNILNGDGDLLAYARARAMTLNGDAEEPGVWKVSQGAWKDKGYIIAIMLVYRAETVYAFARGMDWESRWLGVSKQNPAPTGDFVETIEKYYRLKDAENSKYYIALKTAEQLLGAICFNTVDPSEVKLDNLNLL